MVYRKVAELVPYAKNARTHSDEQVAQIAASIREFGWTNPILVDGNGVIAGHGRLQAAVKLGMGEVPCVELTGLSATRKRAYIIADNKLALNAGWDFGTLRDELSDLDTGEFDMSLIGFSPDEIEQIATWTADGGTAGLTDPDAVPPVPDVPVSRAGDLWVMGRHRLRCGDSTSAHDVAELLAGAVPGLMVTDPPYGVEYDANWRNEADRANGKPYGARAIGKVSNDDRVDWTEAWALFPGDVAYCWHAGRHASGVQASLERAGFEIRCQVIWAKTRFAISRGHYHWQHEPCWYAVRKGGTGHWAGDRKQTTLWSIEHQKSETGHSTQKPVECMRRPIENNSNPGQAVYDPFVGSGTTIIAAEQTGRSCYAMELSPAYVDVCVKRWQDFTGKEATLDIDGRTFADVALGRAPEQKAA